MIHQAKILERILFLQMTPIIILSKEFEKTKDGQKREADGSFILGFDITPHLPSGENYDQSRDLLIDRTDQREMFLLSRPKSIDQWHLD